MRRMTFGLAAAWLGCHACLWMLLPEMPFALNGRVPCVLPPSPPSSYFRKDSPPWARGDGFSRDNNFGFVDRGPFLVAGDSTSVHIYNAAARRMEMTWETGVTGPYPENGVRICGLSADGKYVVGNNGSKEVWLLNLVSGVSTKLADNWANHFQTQFTAYPDDRLVHQKRLLFINGSALFVVELGLDGDRKINLASLLEALAVTSDGRTAAVGLSNTFSISHFDAELWLGLELIDVSRRERICLDDFKHEGRWLSCRISPDGRTLAGTVVIWFAPKPGTQTVGEYPCLMTWEIPTGRRLRTVDNAWGCGWCADGRLIVRNEDGDCYFADAELNRQGDVPIPSRLTNMDDLSADEAGTHLIVKHVRPIREPLRRVKNWLKPGSGDSLTAQWECFDLGGRTIAAVPGWTGGCDISRDGKYFAVGSPDGRAVDVYDLPRKNPGGIVLGLMVAEVAFAILWTAWRRRRAWRLRCAVS